MMETAKQAIQRIVNRAIANGSPVIEGIPAMSKYEVWITRPITESVCVTVEAASEDEAGEKALDRIHNDEEPPRWETDDFAGEAYVASVNAAE